MKSIVPAALFALTLASACDGPDTGADGGAVDCSTAGDGASCGEGRVCVAGACAPSVCGDGIVDGASGEQCDDGNGDAFDGCEPTTCAFTCTSDAMCDDAAPCNGAETCDPTTHACVAGAPLADRTTCGDERICLDGDCVPAGCGNGTLEAGEECDDGRNGDDLDGCTDACAFTCPLWPGATNVLGAVAGGFEAGSAYNLAPLPSAGPNPPESGSWFGDRASLVMAEMGIAPAQGVRMLRFDATGAGGAGESERAEARYALVIPSPWAEMVDSGLLRAHVSAHVDRIGGPDVDTQFDVALHAYDAHPDDGGAELATARGTLHSDALVDSWECVRAGLLLPVGSTLLVAEISAREDVRNDASEPELDGHYADDVAVWFSVDPCVEGAACVPEGDRCSAGRWRCGGEPTCEPVGVAADGTYCDIGSSCTVGRCTPDLTIDRAVDLSSDALMSGRTCAEAPAYSVVSIAGSTIELADSPGDCLAPDDEVLLINLQGSATSTENVGAWELLRVGAIEGAEVTVQGAPAAHYGASAGMNDDIGIGDGQQRVALVRVPAFGRVTIGPRGVVTAARWNGRRGSVLALRAASLEVQGRIDASALGYRTGPSSVDDFSCSDNLLTGAGESIAGDPGPSLLASFGGPGGIGVAHTSFASNNAVPASAGHAGPGEAGLNGGSRELGPPGATYGVGDGTRLTMGSGGAGGLLCEGGVTGIPALRASGTQAGGIVLLLADTLSVTGDGAITASARGDALREGAGSGASGGYVLIVGRALDVGDDRVTARGGTHTIRSFTNHGSDGYIVLDASEPITGTTDPPAATP